MKHGHRVLPFFTSALNKASVLFLIHTLLFYVCIVVSFYPLISEIWVYDGWNYNSSWSLESFISGLYFELKSMYVTNIRLLRCKIWEKGWLYIPEKRNSPGSVFIVLLFKDQPSLCW